MYLEKDGEINNRERGGDEKRLEGNCLRVNG